MIEKVPIGFDLLRNLVLGELEGDPAHHRPMEVRSRQSDPMGLGIRQGLSKVNVIQFLMDLIEREGPLGIDFQFLRPPDHFLDGVIQKFPELFEDRLSVVHQANDQQDDGNQDQGGVEKQRPESPDDPSEEVQTSSPLQSSIRTKC